MIVVVAFWVCNVVTIKICRTRTVRDNYKTLSQSHTKTKLAYVDAVAKPPRGVEEAQECNRIFALVGMPHKNGSEQPKPVSVRELTSSSKICALQ